MRTVELNGYEIADVVDALRRDMRAELDRVITEPQWADDHAYNARRDKALLEQLNPKSYTIQ